MENNFKGIPASPGIISGKAFVIDRDNFVIEKKKIIQGQIKNELLRLNRAVVNTKREIFELKERLSKELGDSEARIFDAHLLILEDPVFTKDIIDKIEKEKLSAEYALSEILEKTALVFEKINDIYLKERSADLKDVGRRLIHNLLGYKKRTISELDKKVIIIAHDISPSDTASMKKDKVIGFATDIGGQTSHTAIIARSLAIPAVVGLRNIIGSVKTGDEVLIDGNQGIVIIEPSDKTLKAYQSIKKKFQVFEKELKKVTKLPAETQDGHSVELVGNIESPEEIDTVLAHGGEGIGLFRTEFLYLNRNNLPTEEEQFEVYKKAAEKVGARPIIIRTLDIGGDKFISYMDISPEVNPFLGLRAIRLCLEHPEIFKVQLRAILRASAFGQIKIMFPMISGLSQLKEAKRILNEVKEGLEKDKIGYDKDMELGVMVETPSAAVIADILAKEVDFFSIGTNDLIQYTLAVERTNEKIAYLYEPLHPAIIRLLKNIIDAGHKEGIWVGLCGEMASIPLFVIILLGMGLDEFSTNIVSLPLVKKIIRSTTYRDAKILVDNIMGLSSSVEIRKYIQDNLTNVIKEELITGEKTK
ncbi:MAG: phosphoenolpyruvate--protein phosphotransferase [bacterium]|nr:phosphoenolpyruvate--protein phosphotransferase [bacterium]